MADDESEEEVWARHLTIPDGLQDVLCKFCKRSKFLTKNTIACLEEAATTGAWSLRWRRDRGFQCGPCYNYQAKRGTKDKHHPNKVSSLHFSN